MPDRKVHSLLGPASVNIGCIEGGIGATSVAASCGMEVCFTYHPADEALLIAETDSLFGVAGEAKPPDRPRSP
jgi:hypothetical protein